MNQQEALPALFRGGAGGAPAPRGRKRATGTRAPMTLPDGPNQRWSLDFVADALAWGRRFRILAIVDDFTREALALVVDTSIGGRRLARELDALIARRGKPAMIVSDNGTEMTSPGHPRLDQPHRPRLALHRPGQAAAERLRRELQRPAARRVPERGGLRQPRRGPHRHRALAARLQPRPAALRPRRADPDAVRHRTAAGRLRHPNRSAGRPLPPRRQSRYEPPGLSAARAPGSRQATHPKLCAWAEEHIEKTLTFYRLPRQHHKHLKSTEEIDKSFVLDGGMLVLHGRPRGEERGGGWEPRRAA